MAKKQVVKKLKKKKWYPILAPKIVGGVLGESLLADSDSMKGRYITMNLMNITGEPKKQGVNLQFKITNVRDGQGITKIVKYELLPSAVKRLIRRGKSKIDDSFLLKTKQGIIRVKTLTITNHVVFKSISTNVRITSRKILKELLAKNDFEKNIEELLKMSIQKEVKTKISKITPIRAFNVRILKLEEKGQHAEEEIEIKDEEEIAQEEIVEETKEEKKEESKVKKEVKKEEKVEVKKETTEKKPKKEAKETKKKAPSKKK